MAWFKTILIVLLLSPLLLGCNEKELTISPGLRVTDMLQTQIQFTTKSGSLRIGRK